MIREWAILLIAAVTMALPMSSFASPPPEIRVLVIDGSGPITISGGNSQISAAFSQSKKGAALGKRLLVKSDSSGIYIDDKPYPDGTVLTNRGSTYSIGDRTFHGSLELHRNDGGLLKVINRLPIERYLVGIVGSEISPRWPIEAMKAQVVAARTYAMNKIQAMKKTHSQKPYDIVATVLAQVYHGSHVEDPRAVAAVDETRGEMLYRNGAIFPAYYHSCCGGLTEHAHNVWDGERGGPAIADSFCKKSPKAKWNYEVSLSSFRSALRNSGKTIGEISAVETIPLPDSPRVDLLVIEDENGLQMVEARELRKIFGYQNIKSTWFNASLSEAKISFTGNGYGHGVGMCQWGAKAMAEAGKHYKEILFHYYPDAVIKRAY
ncbi:MAG: SpoIID/LytB domain-containing protein [Myxococcales bacterium]|nr:SpoIID/LytB domain-containing protein [Myxococcales bacterium]